jgi:hypothetical protein
MREQFVPPDVGLSRIEYKTDRTYPDLLDLERVLFGMQKDRGRKEFSSTELFQDFAAAFDWMHHVLPLLNNHGKHRHVPAAQFKSIVEEFVGRELQGDAFRAACIERGLNSMKTGRGDSFADLEIKVPCLDRVMEVRRQWDSYVQERIKANELR